ncbi:Uncharacterised protein [uncultured archaeon]|nr:Uncharacterised protein [uncultured archaeon]
MPETVPIIPHRFLKERTALGDREPRTFLRISNPYGERDDIYIHGYDAKGASHEHVIRTVQRANRRWNEISRNDRMAPQDRLNAMTSEFPYIRESHPFSSWFHSAAQFGMYGIREMKEGLSRHLAGAVSGNNIEFGSGAYMYTPSVCVDFCEEALLRNPAGTRLLFNLNTLSDGLRLPFDDGTFDSATMPIMMSYIRCWKSFFGEMFRVLSPGANGFILLWENTGGTVVQEDFGVSTWQQPGPAPRLEAYKAELETLGYAHRTRDLVVFDGERVGMKLIEVSQTPFRNGRKSAGIDGRPDTRKAAGRPLRNAFESDVLEFHRRLKEKGIDASFVLPPWEAGIDKPVRSYESRSVQVYFHCELERKEEMHFRTITEFKRFLAERKGAVRFHTTWHHVLDMESELEQAVGRFKQNEIDQCVYGVEYNVLLKSRVMCGRAGGMKELAFRKLMGRVDLYLLYKALLFSKEGIQTNEVIRNMSMDFDHDRPGMKAAIEADSEIVFRLWKQMNADRQAGIGQEEQLRLQLDA